MTAAASGCEEVGLVLEGLRCAGCAVRIERELRETPGVRDAAVNFATQRALVRGAPGVAVDCGRLIERVESLGYRAFRFDPAQLDRPALREARDGLMRLLVAAFLAGNVMVLSFALYFGALDGIDPPLRRALRWLALALSVPALVYCARPFWRGAWAGLRRRELTLDVPIVLGATTAFAACVAGTIGERRDLFMDSAATIVFLMLLGRTLERSARARASAAVESLAARAPLSAWRRGARGLVEVAARELVPGDRVVVAAGQAFPSDGRLLSDAAEVDESLISGEAAACTRRRGEPVRGGTRNLASEVELEVTASVAESAPARLAGLLERAQADRPRLQRMVDRVAAGFAPAVLAAAGAAVVLGALRGDSALDVALRAASVLIVACPCALGLATPAAVSAALGRAAELGLWFRSAEALERAARVDRALLDKTGTLTRGELQVTRILVAGGAEERVVAAAAAVVGTSLHPLAAAIRREALQRGVEIEPGERHTLPGMGIEAGDRLVGSAELLAARGIRVDAALAEAASNEAKEGASLAFVAEAGHVLGAFALADLLRPDANEAVRRLGSMGISTALVSGDHAAASALAARQAGVDDVQSGVTPEGKLARVLEERARGARVVFAGDGSNDAPALAAADLGFAFAKGSDVTVHAADVVSHMSRMAALPIALDLSRAAMRRIREGLGIALAYNAVAVPLAMFGVLGPFSAALAMSMSSVVVTGNALRLLRFESRP